VSAVESGAAPDTLGDVIARLTHEVAALDGEMGEIDMLVQQARSEAERHELKRVQAADKLAAMPDASPTEDLLALNVQLVTLTRRAAVMESQVEVLDGKRKIMARFRDSLAELASGLGVAVAEGAELGESQESPQSPSPADAAEGVPTQGMSRIVLTAQEDLRRDIARAMHDGPAQSLTNIVLQAQIVDRFLAKDPAAAGNEVRQLVSMVQQTLDATKSFIFDVRPMVLDDLGLVPTLRRSARERGQRAGVAVDFESLGTDRRLPMDLESGLFRILDEALGGYLGASPDRVWLRLDWTAERIEGRVSATRDRTSAIEDAEREAAAQASANTASKDLPPALAAMIKDRREQAEAAAESARNAAIVALPANAWREIQQRAATVGISAELLAGGAELRIAVDLPSGEPA
jgi:two-component system, NarL family, sensor histidine kinase DegS